MWREALRGGRQPFDAIFDSLGHKGDPGGKRPLSFGAMPICRFKPGPGEDGGAAGTIGDC